MLAVTNGARYTPIMYIQESRDLDPSTSWEGLLAADLAARSIDPNKFQEQAEADPAFDAFLTSMPTERSKYAIGHYVMSHGIDVPLIRTAEDWRVAMVGGTAMLRSDGVDDYAGLSGLLTSYRFRLGDNSESATPSFSDEYSWLQPNELVEVKQMNADYIAGLLDHSISPTKVMTNKFWLRNARALREEADEYGISGRELLPRNSVFASRWNYIPGINIRVFRDPVIAGKYYIGGRETYHEWTVTEGRDSPDVSGYSKAHYRGRVESEEPQYTLPTKRIIDLYEKVRSLPLFDQTQAPLMELQFGDDGKLYFLQYLKTGQQIADSGEFELCEGANSVICHNVRGQTSTTGESMRIYLDPCTFTPAMHGAGVVIDFNLRGMASQYAAMKSRVAIIEPHLSFKDNHITSAPLFRPPVAVGLWDGHGDAWEKFNDFKEQQPFRYAYDPRDTVEYIEAHITSNGRQAIIDSDWVMRTQSV
jgi:hypothetical protein